MMLEIKDIHKNFGKTKVLKGVNLNVSEKDIVVIIGPSGSGKSTLLRVINELEKPNKGQIIFEGKAVTNVDEYRKERDLIINEIGEFDEEDFVKSGISLEEYTNPNEDTIKKLVEYVANEYDQTSIYSE